MKILFLFERDNKSYNFNVFSEKFFIAPGKKKTSIFSLISKYDDKVIPLSTLANINEASGIDGLDKDVASGHISVNLEGHRGHSASLCSLEVPADAEAPANRRCASAARFDDDGIDG